MLVSKRSARRPRGRLMTLLVGAMVASTLVGLGPATPAQAFTCSWRSADYTHPDRVARVTFRFGASCSDGRSHLEGTIYDTLCDSRKAVADFDAFTFQNSPPPGWKNILDKTGQATNGCGSSSTFAFSGSRSYGTSWKVDTVLYARNDNTIPSCCSGKYNRTLSG